MHLLAYCTKVMKHFRGSVIAFCKSKSALSGQCLRRSNECPKIYSGDAYTDCVDAQFGMTFAICIWCAEHERVLMQFADNADPDQLRIRAGWSGPSLTNGYCSIFRRTEKAKIRLHGCACWSGPSLCAYNKRDLFPSHVVHHLIQFQ